MINAPENELIIFYKKLISLAKNFELLEEDDDEISQLLCKYNHPNNVGILYTLSNLHTSEFYPLLLHRAKHAINDDFNSSEFCFALYPNIVYISNMGEDLSTLPHFAFKETDYLTKEDLALEKALWIVLMENNNE